MIRIMEAALSQKTRLEGKTDRLLRWFVPLILGLGTATAVILLFSGVPAESALIRAVTVVVISCPCALGVAIPLARVAGISLAGRQGILVRSFSAFEQVGRIDSVVFDKTGTITRGQWQLQHILPVTDISPEAALGLAAGLEQHSDHFIAAEIRRQARLKQVSPAVLSRIASHSDGIAGRVENRMARIGSFAFVLDGARTDENLRSTIAEQDPGSSLVALGRDGSIEAIFVFSDTLKEDARRTVSFLARQGYALMLVSGDARRSTRFMARAVGIDNSLGRQSPEDKARIVTRLQSEGRTVAMVGDGVNDAPALASADLAVAVHSGSHLGREVADLTLMRGNTGQLIDFIQLARATNRKVYQNLGFAFLYNSIAIPLAIAGFLTPIVAVCAMLLSSLSVTGNTLLLSRSHQRAFNPTI
jgi:heavy metal translocating P-type ATPase